MAISFQYADPWILLAVIYATSNDEKVATLKAIIAYGDAINHAILTFSEVQGGLERLIQSGYLEEQGEGFAPTEKALKLYSKEKIQKRSLHGQLEELRKELGAPDYSKDYDPRNANVDHKYTKITGIMFKEAWEQYRKGFREKE